MSGILFTTINELHLRQYSSHRNSDLLPDVKQNLVHYPLVFNRLQCNHSQAPFTLLHFHLDPFLLLKTELFFPPVHITPFLNRNEYLSSAVFTLVLKNGSDHLLFVFALCSLFPDYVSVFVCYSHYSYAFLFSSVFI